jgi:protein phosphatase
MKFRIASITDRGLNPNRPHNEDSLLVAAPLFIVADGLGGELAGEVASHMTIEKFKDYFDDATRENGLTPSGELQIVERVFKRVNSDVYEEAQKPEYRNMGSTLSVLYFYAGRALIGHVGDSKVYRVRDGRGEQLTRDQSIVQQMVEKGIISVEQARRHPMRNVLLSCIAHKPDIEVFTLEADVRRGDFYLLCSDGVAEYVSIVEITRMASSDLPPDRICERIKEIVYAGGAMDNLTAIAVYVDEEGKV